MDTFLANSLSVFAAINGESLSNFKIIWLSIILEALPFVLLSVIVSAFLHNFVSGDILQKIVPKNRLISTIPTALLGLILPVCDCGMVPIVRRLVSKGVPLHVAITYMLAAPIINPVVITATFFAFRANTTMVLLRVTAAFFIAIITGLLCSMFFNRSQLKKDILTYNEHCCCCDHDDAAEPPAKGFFRKLLRTAYDAGIEFFDMGKYLFLGAMLGALTQILIPRTLLLTVGQDSILSVVLMMLFAFVISVCSAADAFIAASFAISFSPGALAAFMVFGPMIDLKNILMLQHAFKTRFVLWLAMVVFCLTACSAYIINLFY